MKNESLVLFFGLVFLLVFGLVVVSAYDSPSFIQTNTPIQLLEWMLLAYGIACVTTFIGRYIQNVPFFGITISCTALLSASIGAGILGLFHARIGVSGCISVPLTIILVVLGVFFSAFVLDSR